ncbi:gamma-glutamylcyclotransferase family protein [Larsenimonas salina]|uniref:gamma-glutamylcyclotransferase family protein n=1 Tax=Larsenimonas salina TaxID=1295565 RepID=UPI0020745905|nr:gamma-glutamylcyclotransferase [Larsenimonas salina]MCM5705202.1 gamma-glutamylcyclotransferase [Larsenimonas salina]
MPRLFAYADCLRSAPNHHLLDGARLLGHHRTRPRFRLFETPQETALFEPGNIAIEGEVYTLSDAHLAWLDQHLAHGAMTRATTLSTPYGKAWYYRFDALPDTARPLPHGDWLAYRTERV